MAVKVALSAFFMYLVLRQVDLGETARLFRQLDLLYFLLAFSTIFPTVVANTLKWRILLKVLGRDVPFGKLLLFYMTGFFFNSIFTGLGDIKRMMDLSGECKDPAAAAVSVFMERWTGVLAMLVTALATLSMSVLVYPEIKIFISFCLSLLVLLLLVYVAIERIGHYPLLSRIAFFQYWIGKLRGALQCYRGAWREVAAALGLSFVTPALLIVTHYFLVKALHISVSPWVLCVFIPTIWVFAQVPISINGFGIQDMAFMKLLHISGIDESTAFSLSLLTHLLRISIGAMGGVFYLFSPRDGRPGDVALIPDGLDACAAAEQKPAAS